ncbi:uncharacterized protein [Apostichopus japonicus]|uniref:uncharacterized protein isoform X1 n=1 Tax=Stichopus japonicus TaxID=307972 RepID=UPI003AB699F9
MAQLPNFRQVFPLNHQPAVQQQVPQNVGDLKGSELRLATGTIIILCGVFEIIIATYLICLGDSLHCPYYDRVGWGLWNGAFAIITGSFGLASTRKKSIVITFKILAIIATLICGLCLGFQATITACNGDANGIDRFLLYIIICSSFGLQFVACIIGASATCFRNGVPQHQVITNPRQANVASPYTGVVNMAMQPAPVNGGSVNDDPPSYQVAITQPYI